MGLNSEGECGGLGVEATMAHLGGERVRLLTCEEGTGRGEVGAGVVYVWGKGVGDGFLCGNKKS